MTLDVVNDQNEKVGTVDIGDDVVANAAKMHLVWESVVHANAAERRGTHATKTRGLVSGTGKKPWKQKGTGRARVGEARNPLWRKGGTVFGPQPRSYDYLVPRKVERGALKAALAVKLQARRSWWSIGSGPRTTRRRPPPTCCAAWARAPRRCSWTPSRIRT